MTRPDGLHLTSQELICLAARARLLALQARHASSSTRRRCGKL
jgi:hypothetical protein